MGPASVLHSYQYAFDAVHAAVLYAMPVLQVAAALPALEVEVEDLLRLVASCRRLVAEEEQEDP